MTGVIGAVDGLLGSITGPNGGLLNFIVDNLGNIVQSVAGVAGGAVGAADQIVGNYLTNMTQTGVVTQLSGGQVQKQFLYAPLNALVNIVFNSLGQVVQAVVAKPTTTSGGGASSTAPATSSVVTSSTAASTPFTLSSAPASTAA